MIPELHARIIADSRWIVADARVHATLLGDCQLAWQILEAAADLERDMFALEAEADDEVPF